VRKAGEELLSEAELNALGAEHWETAGVASAGGQVTFIESAVSERPTW
jgi:hypothetical protein